MWRVQLLPLLPLRPLLHLLLPLLMLLPLPLLFSAPCEGSQPLLLDERQLGLGRSHGASREGVGNGRFSRILSNDQAKIGKPGTEASAPQQHNTESLHGRWCLCRVQSEQPAERSERFSPRARVFLLGQRKRLVSSVVFFLAPLPLPQQRPNTLP